MGNKARKCSGVKSESCYVSNRKENLSNLRLGRKKKSKGEETSPLCALGKGEPRETVGPSNPRPGL